jgi:hypothetical protein
MRTICPTQGNAAAGSGWCHHRGRQIKPDLAERSEPLPPPNQVSAKYQRSDRGSHRISPRLIRHKSKSKDAIEAASTAINRSFIVCDPIVVPHVHRADRRRAKPATAEMPHKPKAASQRPTLRRNSSAQTQGGIC